MFENDQNIAVLLFCHSYVQEHRRKTVLPSPAENKRLFKSLFDLTVREVRQAGLPYFIDTELTQTVGAYGDRLSQSITRVFERGYDQIIVIGSDSPDISSDHILEAASHLKQTSSVVGPATDGGTYLIGLDQSAFDARSFANLRWESEWLGQDLMASINCNTFLSPLSDIDEAEDWQQYLQTAKHSPFLLSFLSYSELKDQIVVSLEQFVEAVYLFIRSLRAPPVPA